MIKRLFSAVLFIVAGVGAVSAEPVEQFNSTAFWFESWGNLTNAMLVVTAPDGAQTSIEAPVGTPVYRLSANGAVDGMYRYELTASTDKTEKIVNPIDNGRGEAARDEVRVGYGKNGSFTVLRGVIVEPEDITEDAS